ncbi:MAG: hypothetical protein MUF07_12150 [Steroidobacteraceae bacterium]|jgi:hypothetical protein|nr:hypothetical protein [Steroidobacteraceae bacterium]
MSEQKPIRLFVTHAWSDGEDYLRVFEFLESARNFHYRNCSAVDRKPSEDLDAQREVLRAQMRPAEVVLATAALLRSHSSLLVFQMTFAQASRKPVILLPQFGLQGEVPKGVRDLATESVGWDERALVDAIRRLARGEQTGRWDVVEFTLD